MSWIVVDIETAPIPDVITYLKWNDYQAPTNYKDPIKISDYINAAKLRDLERCALEPDLNRIIALGTFIEGQSLPSVIVCRIEQEEREGLKWLWAEMRRAHSVLVTYNGLDFDVPVLLRRSLYLNVKAPNISVDRYRHPQVVDLMRILSYDGKLTYRPLNFYTQRFGLTPPPDDITGAEVQQCLERGEWETITQHCLANVLQTHQLAARIHALPGAYGVSV